MQLNHPTIILRHKKENLKKCSLRGLEDREDMHFFRFPLVKELPPLDQYLLLTLNAPLLTQEDSKYGLLLIDGTWRYAEQMERQVIKSTPHIIRRSLPGNYQTAYPRRQEDCADPERGLASIEALFIAYKILGYDTEGLLSNYYWKEEFLNKNKI